MNCDSLNISGERNVFATAIYLLLQTQSPTTGEWDTSLQNIYDIFLQQANLLQALDPDSAHPVSAFAVAAWVQNELLSYRRTDVLIELSEINNFFQYLSNYRTLVNQSFTAITTNSLQYQEGGAATDLETRIGGA